MLLFSYFNIFNKWRWCGLANSAISSFPFIELFLLREN